MRHLIVLALLASPLAFATPPPADGVTVYRCRDAKGQLTLRDSPCAKGQKQESVETMIRPRDPAKPTTVRPMIVQGARDAAPQREVQYIVQQASRPVYECTTPDGDRYTSETADGNPRWVPVWVGGGAYVGGMAPPVIIGGGGGSVRYRDRHTDVRIGGGRQVVTPIPSPLPSPYPTPYPAPYPAPYPGNPYGGPGMVYGGGAWVRDACAPMPMERACSAMAARRDDIQRRNVMRQASEAEAMDREQAALSARLRNECGLR